VARSSLVTRGRVKNDSSRVGDRRRHRRLFELSRLMGTSVEQIDRTYGHLLPDSLDRERTALDAFGGDREADAKLEEA
jgi:hypothetical protein